MATAELLDGLEVEQMIGDERIVLDPGETRRFLRGMMARIGAAHDARQMPRPEILAELKMIARTLSVPYLTVAAGRLGGLIDRLEAEAREAEAPRPHVRTGGW